MTFKTGRGEDGKKVTGNRRSCGPGARPRQARSNGESANAHSESHDYKDSDGRRIGIRTLDDHASWQQVYHACDVRGWRP